MASIAASVSSAGPDFTNLLVALQSSTTSVRKQAESNYDALKTSSPSAVVQMMTAVVCDATSSVEIRIFAAVLLRRLFSPQKEFSKMSREEQNGIKAKILSCLTTNDTNAVPRPLRRSLVHCVASVSVSGVQAERNNSLEAAWPEVLPTLAGLCQPGSSVQLRESGYEVLRRLVEAVPMAMTPHHTTLMQIMGAGLNGSGNVSESVQLAALQATAQFLTLLQTKEQQEPFQVFVPMLLQTLSKMLTSGDELGCRNALESLCMVADAQPKFWRQHLSNVWSCMLTIGGHTELESETRTLAIELILCLCDQAGGMIRKQPKLLEKAAQILVLKVLCEVEDVDLASWSVAEENDATYGDAQDEDEIANIAEQAIDRMATSIGGATMVPIFLPIVEQCLSNNNNPSSWKMRRAGLETLALSAAGCTKQYRPHLDQLVAAAVQHTRDSHVRVRYAALHCIGQFSTDFVPTFQKKYLSTVLPVLGASLGSLNQGCERLQCLAVSALAQVCNHEYVEKRAFLPYVKPLLEGLFALLKGGNNQVSAKTQADVLSTISAIASVIEREFIPYYDVFMPLALQVLGMQIYANGTQKAVSLQKTLRGRAMECVGFIASAVGKEKFQTHCNSVMKYLLQARNAIEDPVTDPEAPFILPTCALICECMGKDFLPYMPEIMPTLLKQATFSEKGIMVILEEEAYERGEIGEEYSAVALEIPGQANSILAVNTVALQEKKSATDMLLRFVSILGDGFGPYVEVTVQALLPAITQGFAGDMRCAASAAMPGLLDAAIKCCKSGGGNMNMAPAQILLKTVVEALMNQLREEEDITVRGFVAQSLSECLQHARQSGGHVEGAGMSIYHPPLVGIPDTGITPLVVELARQLVEGVKRQMISHAKVQNDEDCDMEMIEALQEEMEDEANTTTAILDSIGWIIKSKRSAFLPIYRQHLESLVGSLCNSVLPHVQAAGICMLDDVLEHCGPEAASQVVPKLLSSIDQGLNSDEAMIRQACAYGAGLCAQFGGNYMTDQAATNLLQRLGSFVNHWRRPEVRLAAQESGLESVDAATDCAISAIGKIAAHRPQLGTPSVWKAWLQLLPLNSLEGDRLEACDVHKMLLEQVEKNNVALIGEGGCNLPQILSIFAIALRGLHYEGEEDAIEILIGAGEDPEDRQLLDTACSVKALAFVKKIKTTRGAEAIWARIPELNRNILEHHLAK